MADNLNQVKQPIMLITIQAVLVEADLMLGSSQVRDFALIRTKILMTRPPPVVAVAYRDSAN